MDIRKTLVLQEITEADETGVPVQPLTRVVALAVLRNPLAEEDREDLSPLIAAGASLAARLAAMACDALSGPVVSYGKAAIVGSLGTAEHGAALLHPRFGKPVRAAIGGGAALMPSAVRVGGPGASVDLPIGHKDEAWSFDHIDTVTIVAPDAPRADEIVVCLGLSDGPRIRARVGSGPYLPKV